MATLILLANTASPITVSCQRAGKAPPRFVGGKSLSCNGSERTSIRGQAKVIPVVASFVDTATEASIQAAVMNGVQIACSGDILQNIQTLCSIDSVVSNLVPGLPGYYEMSFTVNEVNASTLLLKYAPGDAITGEAFTASTTRTYRDANGNVATAAIDVKRAAHYDFNDLVANSPSLLLEGSATNAALWCRDLSNAAWTKTNMTAAHTSLGADGVAASATRLTATAGNATVSQVVVLGSSARQMSAYVKRITGVGNIDMTTDGGLTWTTIPVTANYTRLKIPSQTLANPNFGFRIVTNADAIDVDYVQNETGTVMTSAIPTTTVAVARGTDLLSFPFTNPPGESTFYIKFIERGTISTANAAQLGVSNAASVAPAFATYAPAGFYAAIHSNVGNVTSTLGTAPAYSDTVELNARIFADGSVDITQSINGGAATSAAQSAALAFATAWSGLLLWPNSSSGGVHGFTAIKSIKVASGARSLAEMRAA